MLDGAVPRAEEIVDLPLSGLDHALGLGRDLGEGGVGQRAGVGQDAVGELVGRGQHLLAVLVGLVEDPSGLLDGSQGRLLGCGGPLLRLGRPSPGAVDRWRVALGVPSLGLRTASRQPARQGRGLLVDPITGTAEDLHRRGAQFGGLALRVRPKGGHLGAHPGPELGGLTLGRTPDPGQLLFEEDPLLPGLLIDGPAQLGCPMFSCVDGLLGPAGGGLGEGLGLGLGGTAQPRALPLGAGTQLGGVEPRRLERLCRLRPGLTDHVLALPRCLRDQVPGLLVAELQHLLQPRRHVRIARGRPTRPAPPRLGELGESPGDPVLELLGAVPRLLHGPFEGGDAFVRLHRGMAVGERVGPHPTPFTDHPAASLARPARPALVTVRPTGFAHPGRPVLRLRAWSRNSYAGLDPTGRVRRGPAGAPEVGEVD